MTENFNGTALRKFKKNNSSGIVFNVLSAILFESFFIVE